MANYIYADTNTDLTLTFETESFGGNLISYSGADSAEDYGSLDGTPTNTLTATPLLAESDIDGDRGEIANQTITPMGAIASMSSTTNEAFARTTYIGSGNLSVYGAAAPSLKRIWVGTGTLFEMGGGMERSSAFWVGSGGLTVAGTKEERVAGHYSDTLFVPFNTEDFGAGFATTSSFDVYGLITDPLDQGIDDFGFTYNTTDVRGASGILPLTNGPNAQGNTYAQSRKYIASGSLFSASGVVEATVAQPVEDTALFSTSGSSVFRASFDWVGSGSTTLSGAGVDKHIIDYSSDSDLLLSDDNYGTLEPLHEGYLQNQRFILGNAPYFPTPDNGEIAEPLSEGEDDYGSIVFGQRRRTVHDTQTVEASRGKFTLGERKETGLRYQTRTLATGVADLPINRYEWVGSGIMVGFRGEVSERYKPTFGQAGSGSLFAFSGAAESKTVDLPEFTTLYSYGGNAFPVVKLDHWTGSGSLFGFGGLVEAATFHYNISSTLPYSTEDYGAGFTTTSTEDIGLITEIQSGGEENWYYINHLGPATPFGTATFANGPGAEFNTYARVKPFIASGSLFSASGAAEAVGSNPPETTALASFSGAGVEKSIFREVFSGSLFTVGGGVERATFDYNLSSINLFTTEDSDLVTNSASTNEDFGSTTEGIPQGAVDFDHIVFSQDAYGTTGGLTWSLTRSSWTQEQIDEKLFINADYVTPETGLVPVVGVEQTQEESGDVSYIPIFGQTGSGSLFAIGGAAEASVVSESTTGLFSVSGSTTFSAVVDYIASGSLFTLSGCSESATFDYNDTTVVTFTTDDQGLITASGSIVDHGSVTNPLTSGIQNNGTVIHTSTVNAATGTYTFSDTATEKNIVREVFGGSLFAVGGAVEIAGVAEESTGLFSTSGSSVFRVANDYVGSGSLFALNGCAESATWDYNETTVVTFTTDDQGLITASGSIVDHGSITNPLTSGIANHGTVIHTSTVNAVTGTYTFGSTSTEKNIVREVFGGSLFAFSGAVEAATFDDSDSTLLATISGTGVEKSVFREVFSGSLFSMGGGVEKVVFDYNLSSIVTYGTPVDNGLISSATTTTADNGSIADPLTAGIENLGTIIYSQTVEGTTGGVTFSLTRSSWTQAEIDEKLFINPDYVTPETGLVPVVGIEQTQEESGNVQYIPIFGQIGSGSLFAIGGAAEVAGVAEESTGLFSLSTSAAGIGNTYRFCWNAPPVTGGLFAVNGAAESATWDYNDSTVVVFTSANNGLITNAVQTTANNGFITNPITAGIQNNGTVIHTSTVNSATGILSTGGSAADSQTDRYIGSGSISTFSGQALVEKAGVAEESTGLFSVSGSSVLIATADWVGSGSLFTLNGCVESATFDYNDTTVVTFTTDDQGLITATGSIVDYGSITNPTTAGQQNNGTVIHTSTVNAVTGLIDITGDASAPVAVREIGTGSLFTASGAAEAVGVDEEFTGLFRLFTSPAGVGNTYRFCWNAPPVTGSLFSVGGGIEKVTFDYGDSQLIFFSDDYGSVTAPTNPLADHFTNGLVAEPLNAGEEDYNTILYNQTVNPYDGGTGPVFTYGYQRAPLTQEDIDLLLFINADYVTPETGLIPVVGDEATQEQSGDVKYEPAFAQIGSGSLFAVGGAAEAAAVVESTIGLYSVSGSSAFSKTRPFIGSGSLFTLNGAAESATWDYNQSSIVVFTSADYGNVTGTPSTIGDFFDDGSVTETTTDGEFSYGTVVNTSTVYPLTGSYVVSGDSAEKSIAREIGGGTLNTFSGQALVEKVTFAEEATTLYDVVGAAVPTRTRDFVGSGSLFTVVGGVEKVTWDYNEDSIDVFSSEDNGIISAAATVLEDNGLVTDPLTAGEENNGTVINTATTYPYGTIDLTGVAQTPRSRDFVGSGSLFTASGAVEVAVVDYESTYLFTLLGATTFSKSNDYVGSGSLFSVGGCVEKVTFDYNDDTVLVYTSADHGLVTDAVTASADDGSISSPVTAGEESNGLVAFPNKTLTATTGTIQLGLTRAPLTQEDIDLLLFINPDYVTPETGLIPQIGDEATQEQSGDVKYEPTFAMVGSGGLFAVGGAAEAVAVVETGTGLFTLSTSQAGIGNTYRFCWKWDSFGTLPVIGGAAESATWDYNDTTVVTFTTDDQGLITATGSIVDYGNITNPLTAGVQNNGTVIHTSTVNAATGTYTFGDAATEKNVVREFSSGSLFAVGGAVEAVAQTDDTFGLFSVSGSTVFRAVVDYVGSGSLFALNGCAESRTYDYSDELLQPFTQVDNGIISAATTTADDNGSIILPTTAGEENNGSILNTAITPAQGTYTVSGATVVVANSSYVGTGSLFTAGGLVEVVAQTDDTTGLFTISGVADTIRSRAYAGSGTLNALSGVAESRTWVYDRDLPTILTPEDYGSVDAPVTSYEDQGQVSDPLTTGEVDYGEDGTLEHLTDPAHGTYVISGVAETPFERRYIGSGSASFSGTAIDRLARFAIVDGFGTYTLFTSPAFIGNTYRFAFKFVGSGNLPLFGGASESKTTNLPESTVIFTAAGTVTDSVTVREVFAGGSLSTFSGQSLIEKVTVAEEATGLFTTSGSTVLRATVDYVGSGSLFSASGAAEAVAVSEEFTGLFTTSGTAVERQADRWIGSGSLFTASGASESKTTNIPESTVLFVASGVGIEKHTERYVGTAIPIRLSGTSEERVAQGYLGDTAQYTLSGSALERESNVEVGSGSLFTAGGAAESKTSNPPESTVIFVVGGSKAESFTPATEVGSGTLSTFSGQALIEKVGVAEEATGLYTISGQVEFIYIVSYVGSGSLFTASGAAESKTTNEAESTVLFVASGTGAEAATVREVFAGGTLSTFSGQALIERVGVAEEDTTLYTLSGAVEFIYRVRYPGSGSINLLSGAAESRTIDLPESTGLYRFSGSKDESFTPATEIGSGSYGGFSGTRVSEKHTEAYFGITQPYIVSGTGTVSQQYHWTGTGNLFTSNGAAESKTTNLPESTVIFTVAGSIGTAAFTRPFIGSGSYGGFSGTCVERVAQADEEGGTITISGDVVFTIHYLPAVGGNLFTVGGGAERVTFNPPEDTYLLVFGGSKAESFTPQGAVGAGSATLSGTRVSEKHTERYVGDFAEFTYSGEATNVKFIPNWVGSGSIDLTGNSDTTRARDFVGSGSIFTASGSAESITTNPPESTVLFTAAGTSVERHTESYVGSGTATLSGEATNIRVIRFKIGSGSISIFSGAAESATIIETAIGLYGIGGFSTESFIANPPEDTAQYTFSGDSVEEQLDHYTGSGVMDFLEGGAATVFTEEKITFSPDGFGLFTFSGASTSAVKREYSGSGSILTASGQAIDEKVTFADDETLQIQLSGESVSKFTGVFVGSGSMFTAGGAAESKTTNQPESTVLFTFSGTAQTTRTRDFVGSGSISITGSAEERTLQPHVGSGSLFAFSGASEAVAFADADTLIARFSGGANESFIRKGYQGAGSATLSGTSEEKHTERYVGDTAQYTISGGATEVRFIPHFNGSGSLFTAGGAAESKTTNKPESTVLFTFSGEGRDRFVNSRHVGSGTITLSGDATTEYRKFEVGFTFVTII